MIIGCTGYSELYLRKEYLMQIIDATSVFEDYKWGVRYRFEFTIRIWPEPKKPELYYEVIEVLYNNDRCVKYLIDFVRRATGYELGEWDDEVDFAIGAVFIGCIIKKVQINSWRCGPEFYNIKVLLQWGYCVVD